MGPAVLHLVVVLVVFEGGRKKRGLGVLRLLQMQLFFPVHCSKLL